MAVTGVQPNQIGELYDLAIGYDPTGSGTYTMVGYVMPSGAVLQEGTQLQDLQRLISVASPNIIDRELTRWPQVTQGDFSGGARQLVFGNPAADRYYTTDGSVDVTKAAALQLLRSAALSSYTANGSYNNLPIATDGNSWVLGLPTAAPSNVLISYLGGAPTAYNVTAGAEIWDVIATPFGFFIAQTSGIYSINTQTGGTAQWTFDAVTPIPSQSMAYFQDKLFYITANETKVAYVSTAGGAVAGTTALTAGAMETHFSCIASTATGLFLVKWHEYSTTAYSQISTLYTWDGSSTNPPTQVGVIDGAVHAAKQVNGVLYILAMLNQPSGEHDFTLYTLTGNNLAILDDVRFAVGDFQSTGTLGTYSRGNLYGDARFLYVGWPGSPGLRYDLQSGGVSRIGSDGGANRGGLNGHRILNTGTAGVVDVLCYNSNVVEVRQYNGAYTSGVLTTSQYDFSTPTIPKVFKALHIYLSHVLTGDQSVSVQYSLPPGGVFGPLPAPTAIGNRLQFYFPAGAVGGSVQYKITLNAGTTGTSPVISAIATEASLKRVWQVTLSCARRQQAKNGREDPQGYSAMQLQAQIINAYYGSAGRVRLFIPDPTATGGVAQVWAKVEDYTRKASQGMRSNESAGPDMEAEIDVVLVETA